MDLAGMLNDGDAPPKRPSQTSPPAFGRPSAPQVSPPAPNGTYAAGPGTYPPPRPSQQQTPLYAPPSASAGPPSQAQSRPGLTPLHTPSQTPGGGQYPFPQQTPLQSPASAHPGQQQYRGYEPYSATTPGARPSSHGYTQPSLSQYPGSLNAPHTASHNASLSPTPPSHAGQTPHSLRQSPLATMGHPPPPPPHHYHQSQPNTPLGPPPQIPQRHSNHSNSQLDMSSPYHQRTYSGASNGMVSGSPAQHHPSIGNLVDSPSVYARPSPQAHRTSDYRSSVDRERSVSVSPKTIVQPRPTSLGSRHSSQQDAHSTRSSLPPSAGMAPSAETPGHVPHPSDVAQAQQSQMPGPPVNGNSLSQSDNKTPLQHQAQKMGMSHLLAPTQDGQLPQHPQPNGASSKHTASPQVPSQSHPHSQPPPPASTHRPSPMQDQNQNAEPETAAVKRPAEGDLPEERVAKRGRVKKYTERPIWARLSPLNPRAKGMSGTSTPMNVPMKVPTNAPVRANKELEAQTNGSSDMAPWERNPPLDMDLINARQILGAWEKSVKWNVRNPTLNRAVADWLWSQLEEFSGLAQPGASIEIEAKIGTLIDDSGNRCALPVRNTCVLDASVNRRFRFDSEMNDVEHKHMNAFLNSCVMESQRDKGRIPVLYQRTRETDSFLVLNEAGISTLPAVARKRRGDRQLSMRTSTDTNTNKVTARIVKVNLGEHLHIFGAADPYDVRISMNLEINLDKPGFDPDLMTVDPAVQRPQPNRKKDRLSYKHLAYSIDLTRVDRKDADGVDLPVKYELEMEVDSKALTEQIAATKEGRPSAYSNIVDGLVDNMMFLTKQPRND